jgi:hypothetical protein
MPDAVLLKALLEFAKSGASDAAKARLKELLHEKTVVSEVKDLLTRSVEHLSSTVDDLWILDCCRCGASHCATAYTQPRPQKGYGSTHRNVAFWLAGAVSLDTGRTYEREDPDAVLAQHMIILDVVTGADGNEQIMKIETPDNPGLRDRLVAALPD